jgi:chemotaxis protein CheC
MSLTPDQEDALKEIINIGIGRAAAALSELIGLRIELAVPNVWLCRLEDLGRVGVIPGAEGSCIVIAQDYEGLISGRAALVFPRTSGLQLSQLLANVENPTDELDLELSGILTEVANIVLNGVLGSLANVLDTNLTFSLPWFSGEQSEAVLPALVGSRFHVAPQTLVIADAHFQVRQRAISCVLLLVFQVGAIEAVLAPLCAAEANN